MCAEVNLTDEECAFLMRLTTSHAAEMDPVPINRRELRNKLRLIQMEAFMADSTSEATS